MARRVILLCDICDEKDIQAEGEEETVTLNNLKPRILAMCPTCRKEIYEPLEQALARVGQVVRGDLKASTKHSPLLPPSGVKRVHVSDADYGPFEPGKWECPYVAASGESCPSTNLKDKQGVQKHMRQHHDGITLGEYLAQRSGQDELPLGDGPRATAEMPLRNIPETGIAMWCPVGDCNLAQGYVGDARNVGPAKNKRSLSTHFNQRHDIPIGEWFRQNPEVDPTSLLVHE